MTQLCRSVRLARHQIISTLNTSCNRHYRTYFTYLTDCGGGGSKSMYDERKYSHDLPSLCGSNFENTGILRNTHGEILGPGAHEKGCYKVPEYFSYHNMSFYDFHLWLKCWRMPSPDMERKP